MKQHKAKKIILYLILLFFLSIKIFHLFNQKGILWDTAVYINMGKYMFSLGKAGLWEPARPLILPIFLGFLWRIGFEPISFGSILEVAFSAGCIYLTYLIGKDIFNENIALLSALLLAFSPSFLFYSSVILTEIPSLFFSLLAVYFLIKKRYFLTGLFIGLSFMTRFLQLFILIPIISLLFLSKKDEIKGMINLAFGFFLIIFPCLISNIFLYKNPIYPFLLQIFMTQNTGWVFNRLLSFYFISLLKENFLVLFVIISVIIILKQKNYKKIMILGIFLIFFIFFNSIAHKEMRFILTFLPYLYLIASYGFYSTFNLIKRKKSLFYLAFILMSIIWLSQAIIQFKIPIYKEYPEFVGYMQRDDVEDGIWISNPIFIVDSNKKADELIYYPLYNSKKIDILKQRLPKAKHILLDTCDILPCYPTDRGCYAKTDDLLDSIRRDFKIFYHKKEDGCEQFIFKR